MAGRLRAAVALTLVAVLGGGIIATPTAALAAAPPPAALPPHSVDGNRIVALQQHRATMRRPVADGGGYLLPDRELRDIYSIDCLQAKQRDINDPCYGQQPGDRMPRPLDYVPGIGTYPKTWRSPRCNSHGEFFCDPDELLTTKEVASVTEKLQVFKEMTMVNCGALDEKLNPYVSRHWYEKERPVYQGRSGLADYRPFNLAVVLSGDWPTMELDTGSLQHFGMVVMQQWGLMPIYNGADAGNAVNDVRNLYQYYEHCPNTAVLIIFPKFKKAYLSAPDCEYLCGDRGGPEIVAVTLAALEKDGLHAAILAGIDEVGHILSLTSPLSLKHGTPKWKWRGWHGSLTDVAMESEAAWTLFIRVAFVLVWVLIIVCVSALLYYNVLPSARKLATRRADGAPHDSV